MTAEQALKAIENAWITWDAGELSTQQFLAALQGALRAWRAS